VDIEALLAALDKATDAELSAGLTHLQGQAAELSAATSKEDVDTLVGYADQAKQIKAELSRRAELAASRAAALAEVGTADADLAMKSDNGGDPIDGDLAQDLEESKGHKTSPTSKKPDGTTAVTAAAGRAPLGAATQARSSETAVGVINAKRVLSGNVPHFTTGAEVDREQLAEAMANKMNAVFVSGAGSDGSRHDVVSFQLTYPEDRVLQKDATWATNTRKIEAGQEPTAIVAAGGYCAPLEILYDIDNIGITNRPVMNSLNRFQVERGGITYRPPFDALGSDVLGESGHTGGLGIWTATDDVNVSSSDAATQKGCAVVNCPGLLSASVYSTYLCLEFPNFTSRFDPEWADATTQAALVAAARFAENQLLTRLLNGSTDGTQTGDPGSKLMLGPGATFVQPGATSNGGNVSSARDILVTMDRAVAYYRNRHRLDTMVPLTWVAPRWVLDLIRADMTRGFSYDLEAMAVADEMIMGWFRARGVNVVWHLDGLSSTQVGGSAGQTIPQQFYNNGAAGAVVPLFPTMVDSALYATGDWLYLDGGTLDLGLVRDSALNARNRYRTFTENFEGLAFRGIESLRLGMFTGQPTGATVGTINAAFINS
jgi:hypothetical protein